MRKPFLFHFLAVVCLVLFVSSTTFATNFYVDPSSSSSTTNGSLANPWKTIAQVNSGTGTIKPGDTVFFKRGQTFSGQLNIPGSGTAVSPVVYTSYGTGNLPLFNNAIFTVIEVVNKQYVIIDGIQFIDNSLIADVAHNIPANIKYAITLDNSPNCTIKNCDISLVGVGFNILPGSDYTTLSGNFLHNIRMVVNTPTSVNSNDDFGANPMIIGSSNNIIQYNSFEECWALSYDYGYDGGAVEFFGNAMNNNNVMYNTAINCAGFIEIGSGSNGVCNNNMIAYNKIINCESSGTFQNSGPYAININNLQYYNNIIVETIRHYDQSANVFWMAGTGTAGTVVVRNNIFWLSTGINFAQTKFNNGQMVHSNNIFRMASGSLGITAGSNEILSSTANLFTNATGDPATWNYDLLNNSAAIDFGTTVGITKDFAGNSVAGNPDAGILELNSVATPSLVATVKADPIKCNGGNTSVTINATGGLAPYTGTGVFTVTAGTYTYTVKDANGTNYSTTITVGQPAAIIETVTAKTITIAGGSTTITVDATGGTIPYTYSLNGGVYQSINTFSNIVAGTYTLSVKDNNGCVVSKSITITEPQATSSFKVRVRPNPSSTYFTMSISRYKGPYPLAISVYNMEGMLVYSKQGSPYTSYTFGGAFVPGTYVLKVKIGGNTQTIILTKI